MVPWRAIEPKRLFARVVAFMANFGQSFPAPFVPQAPPDDVVRQRCKWQLEETFELLEACFPDRRTQWRYLCALANDDIACAPVRVDLVAYADANSDIRFVAVGNDVAAGIDSEETDREVADSNDTKSPPAEPGGKVLKGPGYKPPDIAGVLRKQGWKQ